MKRRRSESINKMNLGIVGKIKEIKLEHPFWGYRRTWAYLRYIEGILVNKKRILRLMREHDLLVKSHRVLKAKRTPLRSKPRPTVPNQWWGIDMTKVMVENFGWVYIVVVLDWFTKKFVGSYIGLQCRTSHWLLALNQALNRQFPYGVRERGLHLMSDNGCQPTSVSFMKACNLLGIKQAFTSYNNPKGNADTERFIRTLKEELIWPKEWTSPFELESGLKKWAEEYNNRYLHSTLGYKPPAVFENEWNETQNTLLEKAC